MSKRWLKILLSVSLAFNLAFVGSFLYLRSTGSLTRTSRRNFHSPAMRRDNRGPRDNPAFSDSTRALWKEFAHLKAEFMRELAKDPIDMDALNDILARTLANQAILENDMAERLIKHRQSLDAADAKEFFMQRYEEIMRRQENRRNQENNRRKPR